MNIANTYLLFLIALTVSCRESLDSQSQSNPENSFSDSSDIENASAIYFFNIDFIDLPDSGDLQLAPRSNPNARGTSTRISNTTRFEPHSSHTKKKKKSSVKDFFSKKIDIPVGATVQQIRDIFKNSKNDFVDKIKKRKLAVRLVDIYDGDKGSINPSKIFQDPNIQGIKAKTKDMSLYLQDLESQGYKILSYYNGKPQTKTQGLQNYSHINNDVPNLNRFTDNGETVILIKPPLHIQARYSKLANVRSLDFGDIKITGSMRPTDDTSGNYLKKNYGIIHSLDHRHDIANRAVGNSRHTINIVQDFQPPTIGNLASLFKDVDRSVKDRKNLFIHCGFGGGRTGTMLASIQLFKNFKNATRSQQVSLNAENSTVASDLTSAFRSYPNGFKISAFVNRAVDEVREIESQHTEGNQKISVETAEQYQALEGFHQTLKFAKILKEQDGNPGDYTKNLKRLIDPETINKLGQNNLGIDPALHILQQAKSVWGPLL